MAFLMRLLVLLASTAFDCAFTITFNRKPFEHDRVQGARGEPQNLVTRMRYPLTNYTVNCGSKNKTFPEDMLLINGKVLWCPNAKVGTTAIFSLLEKLHGMNASSLRCDSYHPCEYKGFLENVRYASADDVCGATSYSFIRNPWDRLISGYTDKIATGKVDPWTETPIAAEGEDQWHPDGTPTFPEFLRYITKQPHEDLNGHWVPSSERCRTSGTDAFDYDHIYKIEFKRFSERVTDMLTEAGFDSDDVEFATATKHTMTNHSAEARHTFYEDNFDSTSSTEDLVRMVRDFYADDIELGSYNYDEYSL